MGCFQSYTVFTEPELLTYQELTGLGSAEIIHAYKKFTNIDPMCFFDNRKGHISFLSVAELLPELAENPFRYRICKVFCSSDDGFMDFDDFLDLVSVMSEHASLSTKLSWAFKIFDFNEDEFICCDDLDQILDNLTGGTLMQPEKDKLIEHVLSEADVDNDGAISFQEFERIMTLKAGPDFFDVSLPLNIQSGGFTLVDFSVPAREVAMIHPPAEAPLCEDCQSLDLCFFNPLCPGCQDILLDSKTTIPELFAVMRQWVPQTQRNMPSLTREILRRGANINDTDGLTGLTLLHYACKSGAAGVGNVTSAANLVNSLISKGADTNAKCRWTDMNALHYAVYFNAWEIVRVLAEQNPSLVMSTCSEFNNGTSLHVAAANLSLESSKVLLQNGANGATEDNGGRMPYQVVPENVSNDQASVRLEITQILKNAAENPPPRSTKNSPPPSSLPALVFTNANHSSKPTGVPKSPAPSSNSTISTTSTQHTANSRAHSPAAISDISMSALGLRIGDRIIIDIASAKPKHGTIRFGGNTEFQLGQWAGIELDTEIGKNDGSYGGIRYFSCKPKYGLFVPMHRISKEPARDSRQAEKRKKKPDKSRNSSLMAASAEGRLLTNPNEIQVGERVALSGNRVGTLRFSGAVEFDPGHWMGIELDQPSGKNDGSKDGVRYFECRQNHGVLVPKSKVRRARVIKTSTPTTSTPISSGTESIDYGTGSGSISLATSGATSGSSGAEASSPSPYASPSIRRKALGTSSSSTSRSGVRSKQSTSSRSSAGSALSGSISPDITLSLGTSVLVNKEMGIVRFIGTTEFSEGVWLGVELRKQFGKNDGTVQGIRYFQCKANHGLFVKPEKATHRGINCSKILPKQFSKS